MLLSSSCRTDDSFEILIFYLAFLFISVPITIPSTNTLEIIPSFSFPPLHRNSSLHNPRRFPPLRKLELSSAHPRRDDLGDDT